jgi:hypothetical protein
MVEMGRRSIAKTVHDRISSCFEIYYNAANGLFYFENVQPVNYNPFNYISFWLLMSIDYNEKFDNRQVIIKPDLDNCIIVDPKTVIELVKTYFLDNMKYKSVLKELHQLVRMSPPGKFSETGGDLYLEAMMHFSGALTDQFI